METITLNVGQILGALVAAMGIPGAIFGLLIWNFQRKNRITESTAECVCAI